jgi:hypothetical protein
MSQARGPKVFITYRREETAAQAGRLYDAMAVRYGERNVFMDVEMAPGVDFVERITESVAACQVLIVVMGPRWAMLEDEQGKRRLDDPEDFVRLEVETALRRPEVTPIPVLVAGARMPSREELPEELRAITRRNALELSDQRWRQDVGRLVSTLDDLLGRRPLAASPPPPESGVVATGEANGTRAAEAATQTPRAPIVSATASTRTKPERPMAARGWRVLRWVLLGVVAIAAIVVAVVLADNGGSGEGTNEEAAAHRTLLNLLPAGIRRSCEQDQDARWMIDDGQATAQTLCGNQSEYELTYGLWRSPQEAQNWAVNSARDPKTRKCTASTVKEMEDFLPAATTGCEDKPNEHKDGPGIVMWWSKNGSRVTAWYARHDHNQQAALRQWKRLVTSA